MKFKSIHFFVLLLVLFVKVEANAQSFPERCEGNWKGTMYIWSHGDVVGNVEVNLTIKYLGDSLNSWIWKTEYLSPEQPVTKDYLLVEVDSAHGVYITDEGDGIKLYNFVFGDKMYSSFDVDGIMLTSYYELIGGQLVFEVTSGYKLKSKKKGVGNFSYSIVQRTIFTKVE